VESAKQSALVLRELRSYHDELQQRSPPSTLQPSTVTAVMEMEQSTVFRHQYTIAFAEHWKRHLASDFSLDSFKNEYQTAYEFYARLPIPTPTGRMAFVLSFSLRRLAGYLPNISVLGGGLRFLNLVPVESEIVAACQRGDILAVRNLFAEKKAAPNDMSVADRTLLFVSYTKPLRTSMY
jgi:hypothetical protein